jgi:Na+-transporting NADH:ubiquinone oxidoreductase subunit NqrB
MFVAIALITSFLAASIALTGWLTMISIGILANSNVVGGTLGFWDSCIIGVIFGFLVSYSTLVALAKE